MDHDFIDKFGVPNKLEHFWMEGFVFCTFISFFEIFDAIFVQCRYHSMDRRLARHMFSVGHEHIPFPPVAGYAGIPNVFTARLTLRCTIKPDILTGIL